MSQSNVNLDECHNVKKPLDFTIWHQLSSLSQRDNDIVACYIMTYTLMYVTIPHQHSWMSQCHTNFDDVAMWHYLLWILKWDINFHECRNLTFININFDGYHNVTSTMMNVAMWHQLCWMSQCDINLDKCHNLTKTLFFVALWHIIWCLLHTYITIHGLLSCDVMFEVSCNVTYPSFYVTIDATWSLMIVTMSNNPWWMLQFNILFGECRTVRFQHQLWWTSQCNINFH